VSGSLNTTWSLLGHPWAEDLQLVGEGRDLNLDLSITTQGGSRSTGVGWNDNLTECTDAAVAGLTWAASSSDR